MQRVEEMDRVGVETRTVKSRDQGSAMSNTCNNGRRRYGYKGETIRIVTTFEKSQT